MGGRVSNYKNVYTCQKHIINHTRKSFIKKANKINSNQKMKLNRKRSYQSFE